MYSVEYKRSRHLVWFLSPTSFPPFCAYQHALLFCVWREHSGYLCMPECLGEGGGRLLYSKGRKPCGASSVYFNDRTDLPGHKTVLLWGTRPKVMGQIESGKIDSPYFTVCSCTSSASPPLPFCSPVQTLHNINTHGRELVPRYVCDLSLHDTMTGWAHKDMGNMFPKYLDVL